MKYLPHNDMIRKFREMITFGEKKWPERDIAMANDAISILDFLYRRRIFDYEVIINKQNAALHDIAHASNHDELMKAILKHKDVLRECM